LSGGLAVPNRILALVCLAPLVFLSAAAHAQEGLKAERPEIRVGDSWNFERTERSSGSKTEVTRKILAVGAEEVSVAATDGADATEQKWTRELNYMSGEGKRTWRPSAQTLSFPLSVGKEWKVDAKGTTAAAREASLQGACKVSAYEKVTVKAGNFDAFKVECDTEFYVYGPGVRGTARVVVWYSPAVKFWVRWEQLTRDKLTVFADWTLELVSTTVMQ
jgi:hypothetical protein